MRRTHIAGCTEDKSGSCVIEHSCQCWCHDTQPTAVVTHHSPHLKQVEAIKDRRKFVVFPGTRQRVLALAA